MHAICFSVGQSQDLRGELIVRIITTGTKVLIEIMYLKICVSILYCCINWFKIFHTQINTKLR